MTTKINLWWKRFICFIDDHAYKTEMKIQGTSEMLSYTVVTKCTCCGKYKYT